jgi:hypothetical protein
MRSLKKQYVKFIALRLPERKQPVIAGHAGQYGSMAFTDRTPGATP